MLSELIKNKLEESYNIAFVSTVAEKSGDKIAEIKPAESENELFSVKIMIQNKMRLTVEIKAQKYSKYMIEDMSRADELKKESFISYLNNVAEQKFKIELNVGNGSVTKISKTIWDNNWKDFQLRATKILPQDYDESELICNWSVIFVGTVLSLLNIEDKESDYVGTEGGIYQSTRNIYERNPLNRRLCLERNGYSCKVCGLKMDDIYGDIGREYIHVHHIEPISYHKEKYVIDPSKELIPVCPNCHAMLHKMNPPMQPEVLKDIVVKNREKS